MKKLIATILSLILVFTIIPMAISVSAAIEQGDWAYTQTSATTCEVSWYDGNGFDITIPGSFNGLTVTSIGYNAFSENKRITSVVMPDTVYTIDEDAFEWCSNLSYIKLSNNIQTIGPSAFRGCALKSIFIPKSCINMGDYAVGADRVNFIIYGYSGSYAQKYANYIEAKFRNVDKPSAPAKEKITSLTTSKKTAKLKWKSKSGCKYKIAYSTSKKKLSKLKKGKTSASGVKVVSSSSAKKTIKKLKSKKKYYFKVCAYKTYYKTSGKQLFVYGAWSKIKSKKIK